MRQRSAPSSGISKKNTMRITPKVYSVSPNLQKLTKEGLGVDKFSKKHPEDYFLLGQIREISQRLDDLGFPPEKKSHLRKIIDMMKRSYAGQYRKAEYVDEGKEYRKLDMSHQVGTILEILRDMEIFPQIPVDAFADKHGKNAPHNSSLCKKDFLKLYNHDILYEILITTLLHDDVEKRKLYPHDYLVDSSEIFDHPYAPEEQTYRDYLQFFAERQHVEQDSGAESTVFQQFGELLPKQHVHIRAFFTDVLKGSQRGVRLEQQASAKSIYCMLADITGDTAFALRCVAHIIFLSYPEDALGNITIPPDVYYHRINDWIQWFVKAYEQRNNSRSFDNSTKQKVIPVSGSKIKRSSTEKFKYGVQERTKHIPGLYIIWKISDDVFQDPDSFIHPYVYDRAEFWMSYGESSRGVGYAENPHYGSNHEKKSGWTDLQRQAVKNLLSIIKTGSVDEKKGASGEKKSLDDFFHDKNMGHKFPTSPLMMTPPTLYDMQFLDKDIITGKQSMSMVIKDIIFTALQKISSKTYRFHEGSAEITKEGEKVLGKLFDKGLSSGKRVNRVDIPQGMYSELKNLGVTIDTKKGEPYIEALSYTSLIKLIQYPSYKKHKNQYRAFVCDLLLRTIMEVLLMTNEKLIKQDEYFMERVAENIFIYFQGYTKIDETKIEVMKDILAQKKANTMKLPGDDISIDELEISRTINEHFMQEFFYLFDDLELFINLDIDQKELQQKPYRPHIQSKGLTLDSRLKTGDSVKRSRQRRPTSDVVSATQDYLGLTIHCDSVQEVLIQMNLRYDTCDAVEGSRKIKFKDLLTEEDLKEANPFLTDEFYAFVLKELRSGKKTRKSSTDENYKDGKLQFEPKKAGKHASGVEIKFVLNDTNNSVGYTNEQFYGKIAKTTDFYIRRRTVLHEKDYEAILLESFIKSLYIQNQFQRDPEKAVAACKSYYATKYIPVYHGENKTVVFGRTNLEQRNKTVANYADDTFEGYTIIDPLTGIETSSFTLGFLFEQLWLYLSHVVDSIDHGTPEHKEQILEELMNRFEDIQQHIISTKQTSKKNMLKSILPGLLDARYNQTIKYLYEAVEQASQK